MSFEKDVAAIKGIVEAEQVFKPATPEEVAARQPQRKPGEDFCPKCNSDLRGDYGVFEAGNEDYTSSAVWNTRLGHFEWDDTTYSDRHAKGFFCGKCEAPLKQGVNFDLEGSL